MKYRKEVALTLREMSNAVIDGQVSSSTFGGVVCLGAFNATLVNVPGVSVFPPKRYNHETLDFSLNETKQLFRMYQERTGAKVSSEVVESIHQQTGGHAGLVNVCGRFIKHELGGSCDLEKWNGSTLKLIEYISKQSVYAALMGSLENDRELMNLLRRLCLSNVPAYDLNRDAEHRAHTKVLRRSDFFFFFSLYRCL